jgi:arylsulfatase
VLVILLDDVGFAASSAFGGPCATPTAERLAGNGLKYNRFHTTALCAPTRAALLSGRNHHTVGMGVITELATSAPGYSSLRPNTCAPLAQTLKLNGYSTAQFGKCHEVPVWQSSPMGPFDAWPSGGGGFEYFYGFIGGETNQYYPAIYEGTMPVEPEKTPEEGYHFTEDMTDKAIKWARQQKALMPDKPFFMYFAPGATHAPHHVPKEWSEKYKGRFDQGWDALREEIFARQKELGVIPQDADLTERHDEIPAWDDMPEELKPVLARQMEVYAGFLEHTDHHVGRLVDALEDLGVLEDTLIYYVIGDNGASAEGTVNGTFNEMFSLNGAAALETADFVVARVDEFGTPTAYNHYAVGWAHAMDTPYQWTKQVASHWGGTRNGTIVHWPRGFEARGEIRSQFHHVIDVAPTVLEAAGLPQPTSVDGVEQHPIEGTSMVYSFDGATEAERRETQYFEMFCNRGIYHEGWTAVTRHSTRGSWDRRYRPSRTTCGSSTSRATGARRTTAPRRCPRSSRSSRRSGSTKAKKYNVLPLDDRRVERFDAGLAGRPVLVQGNTPASSSAAWAASARAASSTSRTSRTLSRPSRRPRGGAHGRHHRPGRSRSPAGASTRRTASRVYCYNLLGLQRFKVEGDAAIPPGTHQVRMEFRLRRGRASEGRHGHALRRRRPGG